jgi:hypothetical protein
MRISRALGPDHAVDAMSGGQGGPPARVQGEGPYHGEHWDPLGPQPQISKYIRHIQYKVDVREML